MKLIVKYFLLQTFNSGGGDHLRLESLCIQVDAVYLELRNIWKRLDSGCFNQTI